MRTFTIFSLASIFLLAGCQVQTQTGVYIAGWSTRETNHGTWITIQGMNDTDKAIETITLLAILYQGGKIWDRITLKEEAQYGFNAPAHSDFSLCLYLCQCWQSEGHFDRVLVSIAEVEFE